MAPVCKIEEPEPKIRFNLLKKQTDNPMIPKNGFF